MKSYWIAVQNELGWTRLVFKEIFLLVFEYAEWSKPGGETGWVFLSPEYLYFFMPPYWSLRQLDARSPPSLSPSLRYCIFFPDEICTFYYRLYPVGSWLPSWNITLVYWFVSRLLPLLPDSVTVHFLGCESQSLSKYSADSQKLISQGLLCLLRGFFLWVPFLW